MLSYLIKSFYLISFNTVCFAHFWRPYVKLLKLWVSERQEFNQLILVFDIFEWGEGKETCFVFSASLFGLLISLGSSVTSVLFFYKKNYQNNGEQASLIIAYLACVLKITKENYQTWYTEWETVKVNSPKPEVSSLEMCFGGTDAYF